MLKDLIDSIRAEQAQIIEKWKAAEAEVKADAAVIAGLMDEKTAALAELALAKKELDDALNGFQASGN